MRTARQEEGGGKQTMVAEGRSDIVWILPIDLFVGTTRTDVSIGSADWLRDAGRGESRDLANIGRGDISFGVLVNRA